MISTSITWVVCAAGRGSRFQSEGFKTPKALLKIGDLTLLELSMKSLPIQAGDRLVLVCLRNHKIKTVLRTSLEKKYPGVQIMWKEIDRLSSGQLASFYRSRDFIRAGSPVAIFNCDTYFRAPKLREFLLSDDYDGVIPCARASGKEWSFALPKKGSSLLSRIAEKRRISSWVTVGLYGFKNPIKLLKRTSSALKSGSSKVNNEDYVAPLYKEYVEGKEKILILKTTVFKPFGSPSQLQKYWKRSVKE